MGAEKDIVIKRVPGDLTIALTDLRLDWYVDVFVPPDAGPGLRDGHVGGHHTVAVVAV